MTLIAVASVKGAPGVTSTAIGLAAFWPEPEPVTVMELDSFGGSAAARFKLRPKPGLAEAITHYHGNSDSPIESLGKGTQRVSVLGREVAVVLAPFGGDAVKAVLPMLITGGMKLLNPSEACLIVDLGRLDKTASGWEICRQADMTVFVVAGRLDEIGNLRSKLSFIESQTHRPTSVVIRPETFTADDVTDMTIAAGLNLTVAGTVPAIDSLDAHLALRKYRTDIKAWEQLAINVHSAASHGEVLAIEAAQTMMGNGS